MRLFTLSAIVAIAAMLPASAEYASAPCDISQTKCALNGGKCNIHFRNRTGDSGGSDGSSKLQQSSAAQAVRVKAIDQKGNRVGNKLVLQITETKTMNVDKKANKDFAAIRVTSDNAPGLYEGSTISCDKVIKILNGNGTCKLFHGTRKAGGEVQGRIGYQCDGGNVGGPD